MKAIPFSIGVAHDVRPFRKEVEGAGYIPWAAALAMAGNPRQIVLPQQVDGVTTLVGRLFGGGFIAVEQDGQKIVLPVLDGKSRPIPYDAISARDMGDSINRTRARAVAMMNGIGLSLYAGSGNGPAYRKALNLPDGDPLTLTREQLAATRPLLDTIKGKDGKPIKTKPPYLGWHAAWAAAKLTDPGTRFEVLEFDAVNPDTGEVGKLPAMKVPGVGWIVGVQVFWRDQEHIEWLPIMGPKKVNTKFGEKTLDHQALENPSLHDWHRAVMRCLAKALAITTGYGYSAYAKEYGVPALDVEEAAAAAEAQEAEANAEVGLVTEAEAEAVAVEAAPASPEPDVPPAAEVEAAIAQDAQAQHKAKQVRCVKMLAAEVGIDVDALAKWANVASLEEANPVALRSIYKMLQGQKAKRAA